MDNGPVTRSRCSKTSWAASASDHAHLPAGKDGRRPTARTKGKVERPFRTVKEAHETLYHFHEPETEAEANLGSPYLARYNAQQHRSEPHCRIEDWLRTCPPTGSGKCAPGSGSAPSRASRSAARSASMPNQRRRRRLRGRCRARRRDGRVVVGAVRPGTLRRARRRTVSVPSLRSAGRSRCTSIGSIAKSEAEERADRVAALAERIGLPSAALDGGDLPPPPAAPPPAKVAFADPDPFQTLAFPDVIAAKRAVADEIGMALAKLAAGGPRLHRRAGARDAGQGYGAGPGRARFKNRAEGGGGC